MLETKAPHTRPASSLWLGYIPSLRCWVFSNHITCLSVSSVWRFAIGSAFLPILFFFISRAFLCSPGWFWTLDSPVSASRMLGLQVATNTACYSFLKKFFFNCFLFCFGNFPISCFLLYFLVNISFLKIIFILCISIMFPLPQFFPHPPHLPPHLPPHQTLFFFSLFKRNRNYKKSPTKTQKWKSK